MERPGTNAMSVFILVSITAGAGALASDEMMCDYVRMENSETGVTESILDCQRLQFREIPNFKSGRSVDKLLLGGNQIMRLNNDAFSGIKPSVIDLHGNIIDRLEDNAFRGLETSLKVLNLSVNPLSLNKINAVFNLKSLESLDLHDNNNRKPITLQKGFFKRLSNLKRLRLGANGIRALNKTFQGLSRLQYLDLSENKLPNLGHSFGGLNNLDTLDVSSNLMRHFPKNDLRDLPLLTELNLKGNSIKKIPDNAFNKVPKLTRLYLGRNPIRGVDSLNGPAFRPVANSLKFLDLHQCKLDKVPSDLFKVLGSLESLDLRLNELQSLPDGAFKDLGSLKVLDLGSNPLRMTAGMFAGLEQSLEELFMEDLGLTKIPTQTLAGLKKLQKFAAPINEIRTITESCLVGVRAWKYDFAGNNIKNISPRAFSSAVERVEVDVGDNELDSLAFAVEGCSFSYIDVSENPIKCDCSVRKLVRHADLDIVGTCSGPSQFRNLEISGEDFLQKASKACNQTGEELIYCKPMDEHLNPNANPAGGSTPLKLPWFFVYSLVASLVVPLLLLQSRCSSNYAAELASLASFKS